MTEDEFRAIKPAEHRMVQFTEFSADPIDRVLLLGYRGREEVRYELRNGIVVQVIWEPDGDRLVDQFGRIHVSMPATVYLPEYCDAEFVQWLINQHIPVPFRQWGLPVDWL